MLLKFRIISDKEEKFLMHIVADANNTFYQLHEIIQDAYNNDPVQPSAFFRTDEEWDKNLAINMFDVNSVQPASEGLLMENTRLGEIIKEAGDKLIYEYDLYNPKSLYIELDEIEMEKTINAPLITLSRGIAPVNTSDKSNENNLISKDDHDLQNVFEDLGELEDLNEIYGEMSNTF